MGITCRIVRDSNGNINYLETTDGQRSNLFDNLRSLYGTEKALEYFALTESENFKDVQEVKKEDFTFSGQETLNKLEETGLADNVYQMTSEEIEAKLVELGIEADVARQVSQPGGYYSNANVAFSNLKDKNVKNVQGWMKALTDVQKNGGIKNVNQELEWIGLEDYLNDYVKENNPKAGNIPSSVVEEYIKSNQIEIVDVTKTTNKPRITEEDIIDAYEYNGDNGWVIRVDFEDGAYVDVTSEETEDIEEAKKIAVSEYNLSIPVLNTKGDTKYSGYQLKGAENYREILLTMPSKRTDITEAQKVLEEASLGNLSYDSQEVKDAQKTIDRYNSENKDEYSSSHWSEANILAHVRMNEKTLPDGRRVLIVNEIQADISQDLKKEQDKILDRVDKEFDNFLDNLIMNKVIIEEC